MRIVYDDPCQQLNLTACGSWVTANTRRTHDSWVHAPWVHDLGMVTVHGLQDRPRSYAYPIGCFNAPRDWAGAPVTHAGPGAKLLDHAPAAVLQDARQGRVLIIVDQSQEGNASPGLWPWFTQHLADHGIAADRVLYLTSDHLAERSYGSWADSQQIGQQRLQVISSCFNQHTMQRNQQQVGAPPLQSDQWLAAKTAQTAVYNCLNRMPHEHRRALWLSLWQRDLLRHGLVSMPSFDTGHSAAELLLPMAVDPVDLTGNLYNNINADIYLHSWISVVTETYVDGDQLLIGEKVFKPMWCHSPFIIWGSAGSLAALRRQGFRTFGDCWDESYDTIADPRARMAAIVDLLAWLCDHEDLPGIATKAMPALRHNQDLVQQPWCDSAECQRLVALYRQLPT
jgi:hypothetical protein